MDTEAGRIFLDQARTKLLVEYRTKIRLAVEALPADAVWWRASVSNAMPSRETKYPSSMVLEDRRVIRTIAEVSMVSWTVGGSGMESSMKQIPTDGAETVSAQKERIRKRSYRE